VGYFYFIKNISKSFTCY